MHSTDNIMVKIGRMVPEVCLREDRQMDGHADMLIGHNTPLSNRERGVNVNGMSQMYHQREGPKRTQTASGHCYHIHINDRKEGGRTDTRLLL